MVVSSSFSSISTSKIFMLIEKGVVAEIDANTTSFNSKFCFRQVHVKAVAISQGCG